MKSGVQKAGKESPDCTSTSSKSGLTQMRLEISANTIGLEDQLRMYVCQHWNDLVTSLLLILCRNLLIYLPVLVRVI